MAKKKRPKDAEVEAAGPTPQSADYSGTSDMADSPASWSTGAAGASYDPGSEHWDRTATYAHEVATTTEPSGEPQGLS